MTSLWGLLQTVKKVFDQISSTTNVKDEISQFIEKVTGELETNSFHVIKFLKEKKVVFIMRVHISNFPSINN